MDLTAFYPTPKDLIQLESKVLEFLMNSPYIKREHHQFATNAKDFFKKLPSQSKKEFNGFEFFSYLDVYHAGICKKNTQTSLRLKPKPNIRLVFSARIEKGKQSTFGNISYALVVCRVRSLEKKDFTILRKFHFDVIGHEKQNRRQQHPVSHLQYCGKMTTYMEEIGLKQTQLATMYPQLSEPRIFFWPMSLASLVDMALHEFPDEGSTNFRLSPEWRRLVRDSELLLLHPFFEKCIELIKMGEKQDKILSDDFYFSKT